MADITVDSAIRRDGSITITGSNFTSTTTTVELDGAPVDFESTSPSEILVEDVPEATEVTVSKGTVSLTVPITGEEDAGVPAEGPFPGPMPHYTESPENPAETTYTPAFPVPISAEDVLTEQDKDPSIGPVSDPVEPVKATVLDINPKEPYPSGS